MIKANELMLGNLIMTNSGPAKVTKLKDGEIHFEDRLGGGITFGVDGIPLSPEILENNGFEKSECECYYGCYYNRKINEWEIEIYFGRNETLVMINKWVCPHINNTDCRFLHQLQQALKLCGIELEIKL